MSTPADHARQSADVPTLLEALTDLPVSDHPAVYEQVHQRLVRSLRTTEQVGHERR
ncbi:MAG: hypothetical protein Q4B12_07325 [Bowdeniella nasicola]|nr:hypothetical protein [Bowdeniella nasicola]